MKILATYIMSVSLIIGSCSDAKQAKVSISEETSSSNIIVEKKQFESSEFELCSMTEGQFSNHLKVAGEIHLPQKSKAAVNSLLDGMVGSVNWIEGQWVSKGATLFSITNPELINMQEDYLVFQGQLDYLKEEYNRQSKLATDRITTQKDLLKAKSELRTAEARFSALRKKLLLYGINPDELTNSNLVSTMQVTAPISGYISNIDVIQGAYLESTTTALTIANTNHMHLELSVLEKDAQLLKRGQNIRFSLQNDPSKKYNANIHLVNKMIDENHMIRVHGHIENEKEISLLPGMFVNAEIVFYQKKMTALPKDAVVKLGDEQYILKLLQNTNNQYEFEQIKVDVTEEQNGFTAIKDMLNSEDRYLCKGAYFLVK